MLTLHVVQSSQSLKLFCLRVDFRCHLIFFVPTRQKFTCVNEMEVMYEKPRADLKVEQGEPFFLFVRYSLPSAQRFQ